MNAAANKVELAFEDRDLLRQVPPAVDVILVGDIFYDSAIAKRLWPWLQQALKAGSTVLIGDPGRTYLPRQKLRAVATYHIENTSEFEDSDLRAATVWAMLDDALAFG